MNNPKLNHTFSSIGELSRHLKGDRSTIRKYIKPYSLAVADGVIEDYSSKGLYRKQWKFTELN